MQALKLYSCWLMGLLYFSAGLIHFVNPVFYVNIMPPYIPLHLEMVYLSGIAEMALGAGLFLKRTRIWAAWGIILMLIAFMPVHIHMVLNPGLFENTPQTFLWVRIPVQGLLILWAWAYTRPDKIKSEAS